MHRTTYGTAGMLLAAIACHQAAAQTTPEDADGPADILVRASPLPGPEIDSDRLSQDIHELTGREIDRTGVPSLSGAILEQVPGAALNETSGNVFQPDILYRGFTASPVAGTTQGIAVYVNGARFNEPFGETVNWDLIPSVAIADAEIESSNPVYGLNALGGSLNVRLKNGFTWQGAELTAYAGSYSRGAGILQYGVKSDDFAGYFAAQVLNDGGWRQTSASQLYQLYGDLGWRSGESELHLSVNAAANTLGNPGASPVQALDVSRSSIFSGPNVVYNKYVSVNLNGTTRLGGSTTLQGVAYYQNLTQRLVNGATGNVMPCNDGSGALCNQDGVPVTGRGGAIVPDFLNGGVYSAQKLQGLNSQAYGASTQVTDDTEVAGRGNHLVAGLAFDGSDSVFDGQSQNGGFDLNTYDFAGPGVTQDQISEGVAPARLSTVTRDYAFYAVDVFKIAPKLDLNLSGRFTNAEVDLHDKLGTALTGQHAYSRFNPAVGFAYAFAPELQVYGGYSEANRAPTPTELSCASAANPCSLANFFIGDPNLKQVVARTFEAGLRGRVDDAQGGRLRWDVDYYRTKNQDDITYQADLSNVNLSFYTNVGTTLREGVEAELHYDTARLHATLGYAFTHATFQTPLLLNSPDNPGADANGQIQVVKGDRIPGVPEHRGSLVVDYELTDRLTVGTSMVAQSSAFRFGDEANVAKPVGGWYVLNLNASYRVTDHVAVFALADNVLDRRYDTYGSFGPVSALPFAFVPGGVTDTRTASPAAPVTLYGGVRVTF